MTANASQSTAKGGPDSIGAIKRERDRFVALAFCAADVLVELDSDGRICFAAGAITALTGKSAEKLLGVLFDDLVNDQDKPVFGQLLAGMQSGPRQAPVPVRLNGPLGASRPMMLSGYVIDDMPGRIFLTLRLGPEPAVNADSAEPAKPKASRPNAQTTPGKLRGKDDFANLTAARAREAESRGEAVDVTLLNLDGFTDVGARMDSAANAELQRSIGRYLNAQSVGGDAAARLGGDNFGLLHTRGADVAAIRGSISKLVKSADPAGKGVTVTSGSMPADVASLSDGDASRAVMYAMNRFCAAPTDQVALAELSNGIVDLAEAAADRIQGLRGVIASSDFKIYFQPIVNLATEDVSHFEALVRFGEDGSVSPYEMITFAEETGLIIDLDLAMCHRILDWLIVANSMGHRYSVAANISGRSLASAAFINGLHKLLKKYDNLRQYLMFEITESARIHDLRSAAKFIEGLRKAGHKVCLDDFGAGAAAFHYLHALDVDVVKIDGQYLRSATTSVKARAFLKAMAGLCGELKISTVAEMVEDTREVALLKECGIQYGQGYLFGRPAPDVSVFKSPKRRGPGAAVAI